jgi:transcriptional regulator with XRE-family HTH domain
VSWRERLRAAVDASGRTHGVIASAAGLSPETLSRVLSGQHPKPSFDTVVRIAHAVDENVGWILGERGFTLAATQRAELRGLIAILQSEILGAEPGLDARTAANAVRRRGEIPHAYEAAGARLIFEARGDSMLGVAIAHGDLLYVAPRNDLRECAGRIVVARLDGETFVKQLDIRAGRTRLVSRNERYAPIDVDDGSFELIGVVVGRAGAVIMRE